MASTFIWKGNNGAWTDATQWLSNVGGIPQPGDTAAIGGGTVNLNNLNITNEHLVVSTGQSGVSINLTDTTLDSATTLVAQGTGPFNLTLSGSDTLAGAVALTANYTNSFVDQGAILITGSITGNYSTYFNLYSSQAPLDNRGTILLSGYFATSGNAQNEPTIENDGLIETTSTRSDAPFDAYIVGAGLIRIDSNAYFATYATSTGQAINFSAGNGHLKLDGNSLTSNAFLGQIQNFSPTDTIDLGTTLVDNVTFANNQLVATYGGVAVGTLDIVGSYQTSNFVLNNNGSTVLLTTTAPPCFASGTQIETARGPVAVEHLTCDDHVVTPAGEQQPIRWIGQRRIDCNRHPTPLDVFPIRIVAGAVNDAVPDRDLFVSPDHGLFIGGSLIMARNLVNGTTITQQPCDTVTYWHIELDRHDLLLANGLAAESYLDTGNRAAFSNAGVMSDPHPALIGRGSAPFDRRTQAIMQRPTVPTQQGASV